MWSKTSKHSLAAGAIEAVVVAGSLILSSIFVITLAFPQSDQAQTAAYSPAGSTFQVGMAKPSFRAGRKTLVVERTEIGSNAATYGTP